MEYQLLQERQDAFGFLYATRSKNPNKTDPGCSPGVGVQNALIILGVANFLRLMCTLLVPEIKGKSLEELSCENVDQGSL